RGRLRTGGSAAVTIDFLHVHADPEGEEQGDGTTPGGRDGQAKAKAGRRNRPERSTRARWVRRTARIAVVVLIVVTLTGWGAAKPQMGGKHNPLDAPRADLEDRRDSLADAQDRAAETQASLTRVQGAIDVAGADRAQLETMIADLQPQ